ncbi:MAG TPA: hypothetical protein EYP29_04985 [Thermoplasmata archaeon]|nr:hypothetical protein [Thermoplasmata archaeon]
MSWKFDHTELNKRFGWNEGPSGFGLGTVIGEIGSAISGFDFGVCTADANGTFGVPSSSDEYFLETLYSTHYGGSETHFVAFDATYLTGTLWKGALGNAEVLYLMFKTLA